MPWGRGQKGNLPNANELEIADRIRLVRQAKRDAYGQSRELTLADLDQVLPEVQCRRSRIRARGKSTLRNF